MYLFVTDIVDKTAGFVARNGPEFESRIHQNEQNNPKFNFLNQGDPYHAYYRHRVKELQENSSSVTPAVAAAAQKSTKQRELLSEPPVTVRDPPPPLQFSSEPPTLSALDLDVVKLTAQFVAVHGHAFLSSLMSNERKNPLFDFTRPQHGLFR
jgi:splicing factor 3A subunit 1